MNCSNCKHLITQIVGPDSYGDPYKYMCRKNVFPSIASHSPNGKSLNLQNYEYYTYTQLEEYKNKNGLCYVRLGLNTRNLISFAALIISIIAFFREPNTKTQPTKINRNEVVFLIDSIINEKSAQKFDTLIK